MHRTTFVLTAALLFVSVVSVKAIPLGPTVSSPDQSPIEKIGCSRSSSNETCPYGYTPRGYGCVPCWNERPRHYRDYDHGYYRDYDHGYYGPRKYPRGYY